MVFKRSSLHLWDSPGDVATDDWMPVPATATAVPGDTLDWLTARCDPEEAARRLLDDDENDAQEVPKDPEGLPQCFSPEELAIIEQQKSDAADALPGGTEEHPCEAGPAPDPDDEAPEEHPREAGPAPDPDDEAPEQLLQLAEPQQPSISQPRPAAGQQPERSRWIEVLKNCGEHLSDLELEIIRKQLVSS